MTFVVINTIVDSRVAAGAGHSSEVPLPDAASDALSGAEADQREKLAVAAQPEPGSTGLGVAFALLAAVTLDGVPENLALGVSLVGSEGELSGVIALLVAIFVSNLPESLVERSPCAPGAQQPFVVVIWTITAVILTAAVVIGERLADSMSPGVLAFALSFAGGAVLASLADTLMPEAFEHGRPLNAFSTTLGFLLAFVLSDL